MQKSDFVAVKYLHQHFPILIAVLGHDNPQSMVLANFYYFWCELSFLLSWESCSSSPVSLEVFSLPQILLTVQTTTKSLSLPPPSFQVSGFWTLENTVLLMYSFLCFIFWFSMFLSVLLSAVSVLYVFLSFLLLFNLFLSLLSVLFCSLSRSTFYSFLLVFLLPLLFSSFSVYSLIFWSLLLFSFKICYPFYSLFLLLYSVCLFVMFLCSTCSLSVIIHLFRALYLIFFRYLFRSCFYFLYNSSFW